MARQSRGSCGTIFIALIVLAVIGSIFGDDDDRKEETEKVNQNIETVMENENHGNSFEVNQNIKNTSEGEDSDDDSAWLDGYTDIEDFGYYVDGDGIYVKEYNGNSQKVRLKSSYDIGGRKIKVISFEDGTFKYSDVTSVILPKGTKHLDYDTFANCNIKYLYLPGSVENPGIAFWRELEGVEKIYYGGSAKKWTSICELERNELEVKQIFVNVKLKDIGSVEAEKEILDTKKLEKDKAKSEKKKKTNSSKYANNSTPTDSGNDNQQEEQNLTPQTEALELSEEVKNKLYDILENQIGFTGIKYVGKNPVGDSNYDFETDQYDFTVTASDDVYRIFQPSGGAVFYENGEVVLTIADIENTKIGSLEEVQYYDIAKEIVKSNLKAPSTADFPTLLFSSSDIAMQRNGNIVAVQSYVDAQNSYGAEIRSNWLVEFEVIDATSLSYNTLYINIDGQTSGDFISLE